MGSQQAGNFFKKGFCRKIITKKEKKDMGLLSVVEISIFTRKGENLTCFPQE
jgi:hypothetical protein